MLFMLNRLLLYRKKLVKPYVDLFLKILESICIFASAFFIVTIVFKYGFIVSDEEYAVIEVIKSIILKVFFISSVFHLAFDFNNIKQQYGKLAWVMTGLLYLTAIPAYFREPSPGFMYDVWHMLNSGIYQSILLAMLSILHLSDWVVKILSKRVNPSLIFSVSFLVIILIGAGLLMLPRATYNGISFIDALFTSTSATCVTGLTTVDVSTVFTPMGLVFIMILIQIGGIGVMTLTSFFALFFMGNTSLSNQTLINDMISSKSLNSLLTTLLYILGFTIGIEAIGAAFIFLDIHNTMGMTLKEEIAFSVFHSISAFCNAGFSTMSGNLGNELLIKGHNPFYMTISVLIILGGIGFPILVNLYDWVKYFVRRVYKRYIQKTHMPDRQVHIYDINTKIVVAISIVLIVVGTISIGILEWNGAFRGMSVLDKCVQSFFTAVCPRTAGFSSVSLASFSVQSLLLIIFLMVIGGASQSTAGGIKVNAFAVILFNIKAILQGRSEVTVFNRALSTDSIRRSNSIFILYVHIIFIAVFMLSLFEPDLSLKSLFFEAISALSTVGASLDLTPLLGTDSKMVIIVLMFIGRVGVLTTITSLMKQPRNNKIQYASGNIIIN